MKGLIGWLLGTLLSVAIIASGPTVFWADRHFQGYHYPGLTFLHLFAFTIPPGIGVGRAEDDAKWAAAFNTEQTSFRLVAAALRDQTTAVDDLSARGQRTIAANAGVVAQERGQLQAAHADVSAVQAALAANSGRPECDQIEAVVAEGKAGMAR